MSFWTQDRKEQVVGVELGSNHPFPTPLEKLLGCEHCPASGMKGVELTGMKKPKQAHLQDLVHLFRPTVIGIEHGNPGGRISCGGIATLEARNRRDEIPCLKERK